MYQERQSFIHSLNEFISSSKTSLNGILEEIGWSKESIYSALRKNDEPTEGNSTTSEGGLREPKKDENVSEGSEPLYTELVASLTQAQLNLKNEEKKSRTELLAEMLKMERDAKRRRISYKNRVHTKHKSHIEIIREVLSEQMSTLPCYNNVETLQTSSNETVSESVKTNLIEIQFPNGNPHTAWKTVLADLAEEKKSRHSNWEREHPSHHDHRWERDKMTSKSYDKNYKKNDESTRNSGSDRRHERRHDSRHSSSSLGHHPGKSHDRSITHDYENFKSRDSKLEKFEEKTDKYSRSKSGKSSHKDSDCKTENYHHRKEGKHEKKHKRDRSRSSSSSCSSRKHKSKKHKSKHK